MDRYLSGEEIDTATIIEDLEKAVVRGSFYPVVPVCAETRVGLDALLEVLTSGFPSPLEHELPPVTGLSGDPRDPLTCDPDGPLVAEVVKTTVDPYVGRVSLVRVFSGTLRPETSVHVSGHGMETRGHADHDADERIAHLYSPLGSALREVPYAIAGDICAITKSTTAETGATAPSPAPPAQPDHRRTVTEQAAQLLAVLAEVGPRRGSLGVRLGGPGHPLPERVLLARFRAAGLERELGQRERDLLRGLFARHRGAARAVAGELGLDPPALQRLVRERGLTAEIDSLRERFRDEARGRRWPREQIEQLVRRRDWLDDLGIASELEREVLSRARPVWKRSGGALARLRRELRVSEADARALRDLLERPA